MIRIVPFQATAWPPEQIRKAKENFAGLTDQWIIYQAFMMEAGWSWMAVKDDVPLAAAGAWEIYPGVAHVWALMTEMPCQTMAVILRILLRMLPEVCRLRRLRRLQAVVSPSGEAIKLLRLVGMQHEANLPGYGLDGCEWHLYGRAI